MGEAQPFLDEWYFIDLDAGLFYYNILTLLHKASKPQQLLEP
ncbi:MAG: hypothetical protein QW369_03975 [Desulfurococcaceae archaeon]